MRLQSPLLACRLHAAHAGWVGVGRGQAAAELSNGTLRTYGVMQQYQVHL